MRNTTTYFKFNYSLFAIFLLLINITSLSAQRSIKDLTQAEKEAMQIYPGFMVTANHNDTIFGDIQFFNPTYNEITLVFYNEGIREQYYPADGDVAEYAFRYKKFDKEKNTVAPYWFVYVRKLVPKSPIKGGAKEVFLERQVHGDITLYNYYSLKTNKINSRRYKHNYYVEKQGTDGFTLKTIDRENYRQMIRHYLVLGNTQIDENLGTAGFGYKYLADIVQIQNAWIAGSDEYYALMMEKGHIGPFSDIPKGQIDMESDKAKMMIPVGNVDLEKDKVKALGRTIVPSGSKVDVEKDKKKGSD
ncbi:MAG: hypothetical protein AB8G11_05130 [Saprospiraceae bacterium]